MQHFWHSIIENQFVVSSPLSKHKNIKQNTNEITIFGGFYYRTFSAVSDSNGTKIIDILYLVCNRRYTSMMIHKLLPQTL